MISTAVSLLFEASEDARICGPFELVTELENISEELLYLHRKILQLPPQRSTALADSEEDVPF